MVQFPRVRLRRPGCHFPIRLFKLRHIAHFRLLSESDQLILLSGELVQDEVRGFPSDPGFHNCGFIIFIYSDVLWPRISNPRRLHPDPARRRSIATSSCSDMRLLKSPKDHLAHTEICRAFLPSTATRLYWVNARRRNPRQRTRSCDGNSDAIIT